MPSLDTHGNHPGPELAFGERRRCPRQRTYLRIYARLGLPSNRNELYEILDVSEEGACIQTSSPIPQRVMDVFIDRSASERPILLSGEVAWSSDGGRTGLSFRDVSSAALSELQELLRRNEDASSASPVPSEQRGEAQLPTAELHEVRAAETPSNSDFTSVLSALAAVRREAEGLGTDIDRILHLIAARMVSFTGARGSAIAIREDSEFLCRAAVGNAPPEGTRVESESGFSGECIRSGTILHCADAESDPNVNRERCLALDVRSIMAVPIYSRDSVAGLMEIFSPIAGTFDANTEVILQHLSETVAGALGRIAEPNAQSLQTSLEEHEDDGMAAPLAYASWLRSGILTASILTIGIAFAWILVPHAHWGGAQSSKTVVAATSPAISQNQKANSAPLVDTLPEQRKLAEQGDPAEQFAMGVHYATGDGVAQDYVQAARWFSLAAEQGHVEAQGTLGAYYWAGRGVPQDLAKAYFWSVLAQLGGDKASKYRVPLLASRLTHGQVLTAQQQANEWLKDHEARNNSSASD